MYADSEARDHAVEVAAARVAVNLGFNDWCRGYPSSATVGFMFDWVGATYMRANSEHRIGWHVTLNGARDHETQFNNGYYEVGARPVMFFAAPEGMAIDVKEAKVFGIPRENCGDGVLPGESSLAGSGLREGRKFTKTQWAALIVAVASEWYCSIDNWKVLKSIATADGESAKGKGVLVKDHVQDYKSNDYSGQVMVVPRAVGYYQFDLHARDELRVGYTGPSGSSATENYVLNIELNPVARVV